MKAPDINNAAVNHEPVVENPATAPAARLSSGGDVTGSAGGPGEPAKLTPEEQMALYEEHLKENDWGHQPC